MVPEMISEINLPKSVANSYKHAYPFPHILIDNFMDEHVVECARQEIKTFNHWHLANSDQRPDAHEATKEFAPDGFDEQSVHEFNAHAVITNMIIDYLHSPVALKYLEELTGIPDLRVDPNTMGGGVHRTHRGGKLDVHADFNWQPNMQMWRRINLLLYLNKDWQAEWGGELELWEKDMSKCCTKVLPLFNRAVIFNTTSDAYHGHPLPLNTPAGVTRDSIALYYYTIDRPEHEKNPHHSVMWQKTN
jgi:Rps23 Pro-64 3,4-dihydroxylase Tpa1-like proline 4-hydroxylase